MVKLKQPKIRYRVTLPDELHDGNGRVRDYNDIVRAKDLRIEAYSPLQALASALSVRRNNGGRVFYPLLSPDLDKYVKPIAVVIDVSGADAPELNDVFERLMQGVKETPSTKKAHPKPGRIDATEEEIKILLGIETDHLREEAAHTIARSTCKGGDDAETSRFQEEVRKAGGKLEGKDHADLIKILFDKGYRESGRKLST